MQKMQDAGSDDPPLPDIIYGEHLVRWLWQIGPITPEGHAIQWLEIDAWAKRSKKTIGYWEADTLRQMSKEYAVQHSKSKSPSAEAPWKPIKLDSRTLVRHIKNIFEPLRKKK